MESLPPATDIIRRCYWPPSSARPCKLRFSVQPGAQKVFNAYSTRCRRHSAIFKCFKIKLRLTCGSVGDVNLPMAVCWQLKKPPRDQRRCGKGGARVGTWAAAPTLIGSMADRTRAYHRRETIVISAPQTAIYYAVTPGQAVRTFMATDASTCGWQCTIDAHKALLKLPPTATIAASLWASACDWPFFHRTWWISRRRFTVNGIPQVCRK